MKSSITLLALILAFGLFAQKEKEIGLKSEIDRVTVFFQGAQINRSKKTSLKKGRQLIIFQQLSDFIDPNSIQVKATGDLTIISVRARKNFEDQKITDSEIEILTSKRMELELKFENLENEYGILELDKQLLMRNRDLKGQENGLSVNELKEAYDFMHGKLSAITDRHGKIKRELNDLNKQLNKINQEIYSQRSKPVVNYSEVAIEVDVNNSTSAEFFVNYITPNASWKPYYDMRSAGVNQSVSLQAKGLVSQTTGIEWNDVNLTLSTNDPYQNTEEPTLNPWYLSYYNSPQQLNQYVRETPTFDYTGQKIHGEVIDAETGESMPFAKISFLNVPNVSAVADFDGKFSLIVPTGANYLTAEFIGYSTETKLINSPYLKFFLRGNDLVIDRPNDKITKKDLKKMPVRSSEQTTIAAYSSVPGIMREKSKRSRKNMGRIQLNETRQNADAYTYADDITSTVTQKDLRIEYEIQTSFSVPSNGVEQRVSIAEYKMNASYEYHSVPKLDPSVYLVANISGWEKLNLLNGESNIYFDGTYIGKSFVDANSLKDTLTFSLGKDNKVQINRKRIVAKSSSRVLGSRRKFEVAWEINIKNNGGASIPLIIKDQFPISSNNDIKLKLGSYQGASLDEKTNILTWKTQLMTGDKKQFIFDYKVDYNNGTTLYIE
ncbi:MAG: mucoidy inhibitor MuiA family protein [Crocinitomicaceae bacterium]|nr:mucoidy inhibitor MuiA family protein [Crocinitomicaceae bacterium]